MFLPPKIKLMALASLLAIIVSAVAVGAAPIAQLDASPSGYILLTIFLKHDQSKTLGEINQELARSGFWRTFPPQGIEVESWYVVMGLGQVVILPPGCGR